MKKTLLCALMLALPALAQNSNLVWATFTNKEPNLSTQGGGINTYAYNEKNGDASVTNPERSNDQASFEYSLSKANGSSYGGVGIGIGGPESKVHNLSDYRVLRIKALASSKTTLRIRIGGTDQNTLNSGCYPVQFIPAPQKMDWLELFIPSFSAESYCGNNAKSIAQTLPAVSFIEIADAELPANGTKKAKISIEQIELSK
jgi:hypothetical protein